MAADRILITVGGSAAFLEILRRWLRRRQEKRQEQLHRDLRILEEGHALCQEADQRDRPLEPQKVPSRFDLPPLTCKRTHCI